ncbi:hypothetical protein MNBD_GAMMA08-987 [hydrothermal vent metagenome]|uniref:N-acetylmuramoyl-L-alanine amidase n=1 Tax=hydrothermal vent metagenome TaxID=652676 RepID=A0A3B0XSM1_9ZZZZ
MPTTTPLWKYADNITFIAPKRSVKTVFLHCSASDNSNHDDVSVMEEWHKKRGFSGVGYHFFINKNGDIQQGRDLEKIPAAQKGHNTNSIAICLHGLKIEKFTQPQFDSVKNLCTAIDSEYSSINIRFRGHKEVSNKSCPVFDYKTVLSLDKKGLLSKISVTSKATKAHQKKPTKHSSQLEITDRGNDVKALQALLNNIGYFTVQDGLFGQSTELAVKNFQRRNQLVDDGIVGAKTRAKLLHVAGGDFFESKKTLKFSHHGDEVRSLQYVLLNHGEKRISPDGMFGVNTRSAVISVQKKLRLYPDGIVGNKTRTALQRKNYVKAQFHALNKMAS